MKSKIILALSVVLILCACGGADDTADAAADATTKTTIKITKSDLPEAYSSLVNTDDPGSLTISYNLSTGSYSGSMTLNPIDGSPALIQTLDLGSALNAASVADAVAAVNANTATSATLRNTLLPLLSQFGPLVVNSCT